jgi:hypothetical protein
MPSGVFRGQITRIVGSAVYLTVPKLAPGREFGPAEGLPGVVLAQGSRVLVGLLDGRPDDVAILRQLP